MQVPPVAVHCWPASRYPHQQPHSQAERLLRLAQLQSRKQTLQADSTILVANFQTGAQKNQETPEAAA